MKNLISLMLLLATAGSFGGELKPLRVGVSVDFRPVAFYVSDELQGIEVDFANKIAERLDRSVEFRVYQLDQLFTALEESEIDVIMSAISVTDERAARVRFTKPYMETGQMAIVRTEDATEYSKTGALTQAGLKVGVHRGATGEKFVRKEMNNPDVYAYPSVETGLGALRNSVVDLFIHDSTTSSQLTSSFVNDNLLSLNRYLTKESVAWAVHPDNPELQTALNLILADMIEQGEVQAVLKRWLPVVPVEL
jgi:polar amino acid transport system substrate-binding protein